MKISKRKWLASAVVVSALTVTSTALAAFYWTAWTSEEVSPVACDQYEATVGFGCRGSYCDDVALLCETTPDGTTLDHSTDYWSDFFSEEGASDIDMIQCGSDGCRSMGPNGKNVHYCHGGSGVVTGIDCNGRYCDNISLQCTKPALGTLQSCSWSGSFSEEQHEIDFGPGRVITAVECSGKYCDNKRFRVCSLVGWTP